MEIIPSNTWLKPVRQPFMFCVYAEAPGIVCKRCSLSVQHHGQHHVCPSNARIVVDLDERSLRYVRGSISNSAWPYWPMASIVKAVASGRSILPLHTYTYVHWTQWTCIWQTTNLWWSARDINVTPCNSLQHRKFAICPTAITPTSGGSELPFK